MQHIHTLTGLRGLAALMVFVSHSANQEILPGIVGHGFGRIGVVLFFVLSGFLMAHLYVHEETSAENIKKYALARIGRVFPLYFPAILISVAATQLLGPDSFYPFKLQDPGLIIRSLLLIDAQYVFWTIPVEVQFYALFVGFWVLFKRGVSKFWLFLFIVLSMLPSVVIFSAYSKILIFVTTYSFLFFIGVWTALLFDKIKKNKGMRLIFDRFGFLAMVLLFLNLPELRLHYGLVISDEFFLRTWLDPVNLAVVYLLFLGAALNAKSLAILNTKFFASLGEVSYGFYIMHFPVLMFFVEHTSFNNAAKFILAFAATLAISHLSYKYFEKPMAKRIRQVGSQT